MSRNIFHFFRHISKMGSASGNKRAAYALINIIFMALSVGGAVCVKLSLNLMTDGSFIGGLIFLIVSAAATIMFFLYGFFAQLALVFIAGIGIKNPEQRGGNIAALVIALITLAALITACVLLLQTI